MSDANTHKLGKLDWFWDESARTLYAYLEKIQVMAITRSGVDLNVVDFSLDSEARGDIMRRGASVWERVSAKTSGQILVGDGTDVVSVALSGATLSAAGALSAVLRATLAQDALAKYPIELTRMRVWDALQTNLPGTAAADDMGLITGTLGTDAPTLQGVDFGGTSTDEMCRFQFQLPPEYDAGETITLRVRAAMLTTVSDGTATVDAEVYKQDGDGAVGSDICATAATTINAAADTPVDVDFTVTPTGLVAGDVLDIRLAFGGSDTGNAGVMIPEISAVTMLLDIKG